MLKQSWSILIFLTVLLSHQAVNASQVKFLPTEKIMEDTEQILRVRVGVPYILGDADTKSSAREMALKEAKIKASDIAGSYIKVSRSISGDKITKEDVTLLSSALMSSVVVSEKGFVQGEQIGLHVIVEVVMDKKSILGKLDQLKNNSATQEKIKEISRENSLLRSQLAALNNQEEVLSDKLISTRTKIINSIQSNAESTYKLSLVRKTILLDAKSNAQAYLQDAKDSANSLIDTITNYTPVNFNANRANYKFNPTLVKILLCEFLRRCPLRCCEKIHSKSKGLTALSHSPPTFALRGNGGSPL